jgi:hypothetical protein
VGLGNRSIDGKLHDVAAPGRGQFASHTARTTPQPHSKEIGQGNYFTI